MLIYNSISLISMWTTVKSILLMLTNQEAPIVSFFWLPTARNSRKPQQNIVDLLVNNNSGPLSRNFQIIFKTSSLPYES